MFEGGDKSDEGFLSGFHTVVVIAAIILAGAAIITLPLSPLRCTGGRAVAIDPHLDKPRTRTLAYDRRGYFWPVWTLFGMGIALAFSAWDAFGSGAKSITDADVEAEMKRMKDDA